MLSPIRFQSITIEPNKMTVKNDGRPTVTFQMPGSISDSFTLHSPEMNEIPQLTAGFPQSENQQQQAKIFDWTRRILPIVAGPGNKSLLAHIGETFKENFDNRTDATFLHKDGQFTLSVHR